MTKHPTTTAVNPKDDEDSESSRSIEGFYNSTDIRELDEYEGKIKKRGTPEVKARPESSHIVQAHKA